MKCSSTSEYAKSLYGIHWQPSHDPQPAIEAPAGSTFISGDAYPPGTDVETRVQAFENGPTRHWFNPVYAKAHSRGGHFVPWRTRML